MVGEELPARVGFWGGKQGCIICSYKLDLWVRLSISVRLFLNPHVSEVYRSSASNFTANSPVACPEFENWEFKNLGPLLYLVAS